MSCWTSLSPPIPGVAVEPGVTVASRQHPDYDSLGVQFGEITTRSNLNETTGYDDNVLARKSASGSAFVEMNAVLEADYDHSDAWGPRCSRSMTTGIRRSKSKLIRTGPPMSAAPTTSAAIRSASGSIT
jgi:hypothetical protein